MDFLFGLILLCLITFINTQIVDLNLLNTVTFSTNFDPEIIWEAETFPNPILDKKCMIENQTYLCDPENILLKSAQKNIINELKLLKNITSKKPLFSAFHNCQNQGLIGGVAIANKFVGGSSKTLKYHANQLLKAWKMDEKCQKSILILIAIKDRSFWIAKDSNVKIHSNYFTDLFNNEKETFRSKNYEAAVIKIIREISTAPENYDKKNKNSFSWVSFLKYAITITGIAIIICLCCHCMLRSKPSKDSYRSGNTYVSDTHNNFHHHDDCGGFDGGDTGGGGGGSDGGGGGGDW